MPRREWNKKASEEEPKKEKKEKKENDKEKILSRPLGTQVQELGMMTLTGFKANEKDFSIVKTIEDLEDKLGKNPDPNASLDKRVRYLVDIVFGADEEDDGVKKPAGKEMYLIT